MYKTCLCLMKIIKKTKLVRTFYAQLICFPLQAVRISSYARSTVYEIMGRMVSTLRILGQGGGGSLHFEESHLNVFERA